MREKKSGKEINLKKTNFKGFDCINFFNDIPYSDVYAQ